MLARRKFISMTGAIAVLPSALRNARAQGSSAGPKLTQVLRADLEGQGHKVEETVVNILTMPPGAGAPWHMHPGAQEIIFVIEGTLTVEVDGRGTTASKAGETVLIPADIAHLARNDGTNETVKALVTHSRADKEKPLLVPVKRST